MSAKLPVSEDCVMTEESDMDEGVPRLQNGWTLTSLWCNDVVPLLSYLKSSSKACVYFGDINVFMEPINQKLAQTFEKFQSEKPFERGPKPKVYHVEKAAYRESGIAEDFDVELEGIEFKTSVSQTGEAGQRLKLNVDGSLRRLLGRVVSKGDILIISGASIITPNWGDEVQYLDINVSNPYHAPVTIVRVDQKGLRDFGVQSHMVEMVTFRAARNMLRFDYAACHGTGRTWKIENRNILTNALKPSFSFMNFSNTPLYPISSVTDSNEAFRAIQKCIQPPPELIAEPLIHSIIASDDEENVSGSENEREAEVAVDEVDGMVAPEPAGRKNYLGISLVACGSAAACMGLWTVANSYLENGGIIDFNIQDVMHFLEH